MLSRAKERSHVVVVLPGVRPLRYYGRGFGACRLGCVVISSSYRRGSGPCDTNVLPGFPGPAVLVVPATSLGDVVVVSQGLRPCDAMALVSGACSLGCLGMFFSHRLGSRPCDILAVVSGACRLSCHGGSGCLLELRSVHNPPGQVKNTS